MRYFDFKSEAKANYIRHGHQETVNRLKRWIWEGNQKSILAHLDNCQLQVQATTSGMTSRPVFRKGQTQVKDIDGQTYPHRTVLLSPDWGNNTSSEIRLKMEKSRLKPWALFWADSNRSLKEISDMLSINGPVIFDCMVDKAENCYPMIPSGKPHNQMLLGDQDEEEKISEEGKVLV